ncbi:hypothetical protein SAMN06265360_12011 [Haloechinothrix alba]|uniref:Replication initiation protein n=1 Tax=Haloechinothrix alba TaxID=664784 RepID=A0A238Z968_9PSEU|nr:replication initiator [Haloechinothrix alba]SNR79867.1 hypothetical protein SAMN06265360_12011 [Haloechinothrix alba]
MSVSALTLTPNTTTPVLGAGAMVEPVGSNTTRQELLARANRHDYASWLAHVAPAAACSHPVRLKLEAHWHNQHRPDEIDRVSDDVPDGMFYVACKNRRASVCPACSETYRADTYQLVKAGLMGGKGVPETVTEHPCLFVTLTAPSFGPVHTRVVTGNGTVRPCRARRNAETCPHGVVLSCTARHAAEDSRVGEPLCRDCYDYDHQAVWNFHAGELWRRTTIALNRRLRAAAKDLGVRVRLSYAKVAEYQRRGVVHFHALIRLDGYDPADPDTITTPDAAITSEHLRSYITDAASTVAFATTAHPRNPGGWTITWGSQLDIRPVHLAASDIDDHGALTTTAVAGYLAKYATKATEEAGHVSRRLTETDIQIRAEHDSHQTRQLVACWFLGKRPFNLTTLRQREQWADTWGKLQKWAHMLGFGGHFSTKSRRYSTTLTALRAVRKAFQRGQQPPEPPDSTAQDDDPDGDDAVVTLVWLFDGTGWLTTGDAQLANTSAALAREKRRAAREEIEHDLAA